MKFGRGRGRKIKEQGKRPPERNEVTVLRTGVKSEKDDRIPD